MERERLDNTYASGTGLRIKMNMGTYSTEYSDTIKAASTTLLIFDCSGAIAYKYRYDQDSAYTPFQSVWAASSPASLLSVSLSPQIGQEQQHCDVTYTATPSNCSGTKTYTWKVNGGTISSGSPNTFTWGGPSDAVVSVELSCSTSGSCNPAKARAVYDVIAGTPCDPSFGKGQVVYNKDAEMSDIISGLLGIVPNPTDNKTTIYYSLAKETAEGEIRITDIYGKTVEIIPLTNGSIKAELDCSGYVTGVYFYSMVIDGQIIQTEKLSVIK